MIKNNKEKQFIFIIKYTPPLFIILISSIIIIILYLENKRTFTEEKNRIEIQFVKENKQIIKENIQRVYTFINHLKETAEDELKSNIKNRVYEAHSIARNIYNNFKDTKTKDEILEIIKISLNEIRFNEGRGYFFLNDIHGNVLLHPIDKSLEGENLLESEDINGYKFINKVINSIKNKTERFDEYYWKKPNNKKEAYKKISFYKYFEPYDLSIGSGEYIDSYQTLIKQKVLSYISLLRYKKNGYIFVIDYEGTYLSHFRKEYIGKNALKNNDTVNIKIVIEDLINIAKKGSGHYTYIQNVKPDNSLAVKKTSYVQGIKDWNWMIGTGFYEDDINELIEERKKEVDIRFQRYFENIVVIGILLTISLLFISIYISKILEKKFNAYKIDINNQQGILYQQSKMAAMGEMIGNIAHQWRQPLSTITTASTGMMIQKDFGTLSDEFFYEASNRINNSAQHLSKTIDDFRNFFNPDKTEIEFNLEDTFKKTFSLVEAQFKNKEITLVTNMLNIKLVSLENELIQALINILNNARDELVKIEGKRYIFIDITKQNDNVIIVIRDNAGGVPPLLLERIFEPYFTTKHKSQGTGIGLYMTEEIITKHLRGKFLVRNRDFIYENENYRGAEFKIYLPIK